MMENSVEEWSLRYITSVIVINILFHLFALAQGSVSSEIALVVVNFIMLLGVVTN